ncbi:apoptosis-inducing factor 1, mitochondrial isoform X2 [Bacillus rossius redtenbacheri]|uniref:apoptosis-inducing factor 1, mitochondrial isoform X2 n=1 Tax=Bacillus rossius redtenbacheri TaxID=93214 RepID=UPI002FDCC032
MIGQNMLKFAGNFRRIDFLHLPQKANVQSFPQVLLATRAASGDPVRPTLQPKARYSRTSAPREPPDQKKSYTKLLLGGATVLLASLAAIYWLDLLPKKDGKHPVADGEHPQKRRKKRTVPKSPEQSSDIPESVPYLLIGGGTASFAAFRAIKSSDPKAKVLVVSSDAHLPHMRPPLSKEMWLSDDAAASSKLVFKQWNGTERSIFYEPEEFYSDCKQLMGSENGGVAVARGWTVKKIDVAGRKAYLEDDYAISYDKCLIATGASPKTLPLLEAAPAAVQERVSTFRSIGDFQELDRALREGGVRRVVVVGGGFLGSELACALARRAGKQPGLSVTQVYREPGNMARVLPAYLSRWTTAKVRAEGVEVIPGASVDAVRVEAGSLVLALSNGTEVRADRVVLAVGVAPNTQLAASSGLEVHPALGGFLVNTELLARSDLWAAGDCTCFYDEQLGRRRVEHHDHAVVSGRLAGENMTGAGKPYWHQSMFWSDLGPDVGYEAIGLVDSSLPTVGVFAAATAEDSPRAVVTASDDGIRSATEAVQAAAPTTPPAAPTTEEYGKGVVFYLRDSAVVGILLWNVFNRMSVARQVLKSGKTYEDLNEVAKLFDIHRE